MEYVTATEQQRTGQSAPFSATPSADGQHDGASSATDEATLAAQVAANKALVARFVDELWNRGNLSAIDEMCAHYYELHDPALPSWEVLGPTGLKQMAAIMRTAFPDFRVDIEDQFGEADRVVTRVRQTGTHKGDFAGLAPTGKRICISAISVERIERGKIAESWGTSDQLGLRQQLGLLPGPTQP